MNSSKCNMSVESYPLINCWHASLEYEKLHLNSKYGECIAIGSSFILYIYYIYFTKKNGILKRTTSDIFNVEKKTVHVLKQLRTWYICSTRMLKIRFEMLTFNVNLTPF